MTYNSNRLFSEFLSKEELSSANYFSYFATVQGNGSISLLPSDHCLYYPLEFDVHTKAIAKGELNFFNKVFYEKFKEGNDVPSEKYDISKREAAGKKAIIINLLDNCYGHSFLKLLNLFSIHKKYGAAYDLWVMAPAAIRHFIPEDKFYIVELFIGFNDAMNCYSMAPVLDHIKKRYAEIDYVTLDTYSPYEKKEEVISFFPFLPIASQANNKKYITFYYRSDYFRTWAGNKQHKLITAYFKILRNFFTSEVEFVVVGDLDSMIFPASLKDKRTNKFGKETDLEYNRIFASSHLVIGLIGSNMLQPSMFCDLTIHLTPRSKVTIVAEEFFNVRQNAIQAWFNNIYIYGNENCSDISPGSLAEKTILLFLTYIAKCYKKDIFSDKHFLTGKSQAEYFREQFAFFDLEKANALKNRVTDESFNYNLLRYRIIKLFKKLKLTT